MLSATLAASVEKQQSLSVKVELSKTDLTTSLWLKILVFKYSATMKGLAGES